MKISEALELARLAIARAEYITSSGSIISNDDRFESTAIIARALLAVVEAAGKVKRGCNCDYDYRCSNCQAIINLHNILTKP